LIRALIFDFDGLILDTELPEFQSWQEIYEENGCTLPIDLWAECIGTAPNVFDPFEYLEAQIHRPVDRDPIRIRRRRRHQELIALQAPLPGLETYLADAKRLGLKVAVASSSPREWVHGHLERIRLRPNFVCLKCAGDVAQVKPDPSLYRLALEELEVQPHEAIAFEDSAHGVAAARGAGIYCVAVPNAMTCHLNLDHASLRLSSLADVPLEALLAKLSKSGG